MGKKCCVEGCENTNILAKNMCTKHYKQMYRYGKILKRTKRDPNEIIKYDDYAEIILYDNNGNEKHRAKIDIDDIENVNKYKWYSSFSEDRYYVQSDNVNGKRVYLHRFIMNCYDTCKIVDHINHNTFDNRKSNLRVVTASQNNMNRILSKNNTTGKTGVYYNKNNKYEAYITIDGEKLILGYFDSFEKAINIRKQAEIEYFGEYRYIDE